MRVGWCHAWPAARVTARASQCERAASGLPCHRRITLWTNRGQVYVATHPQIYRLIVALYARKLLAAGRTDDKLAVRSVLELSLQQYNSKLQLPGGAETSFAHTDGDWTRPGFGNIPAVQCVVPTSPSHFDGRELFGFDFYDLSGEEARLDIDKHRATLSSAPLE